MRRLLLALLVVGAAASSTPLPCPEQNADLQVVDAAWAFRGPQTYIPLPGMGDDTEKKTKFKSDGDDDTDGGVSSAGAIQQPWPARRARGSWAPSMAAWPLLRLRGRRCHCTGSLGAGYRRPARALLGDRGAATGAAVGRPEVVLAGCGGSTSSSRAPTGTS